MLFFYLIIKRQFGLAEKYIIYGFKSVNGLFLYFSIVFVTFILFFCISTITIFAASS